AVHGAEPAASHLTLDAKRSEPAAHETKLAYPGRESERGGREMSSPRAAPPLAASPAALHPTFSPVSCPLQIGGATVRAARSPEGATCAPSSSSRTCEERSRDGRSR